jgi:putative membrane protein
MMGFGFGFPFMFIFWILIIGLVIWAVIQLANRSGGGQSSNHYPQLTSQQEDALEVLKKRYARGEITKSEYEEMRRDLLA